MNRDIGINSAVENSQVRNVGDAIVPKFRKGFVERDSSGRTSILNISDTIGGGVWRKA